MAASWIKHRGKRILLTDISNCDEECQLETLAEANRMLKQEPVKSVLCLLDTTGTETTVNVNLKLNKDKKDIKEKIRAQAVVGCKGIQHWIASIFMPGIHCFETREEAKEWLVKKAECLSKGNIDEECCC